MPIHFPNFKEGEELYWMQVRGFMPSGRGETDILQQEEAARRPYLK
jgi:hypothetical protein